ncbi:TPA: DUF86 domain-containing protein [Candidatus Micrarchaeota archaeon]|nr:MAG: hypothetical protein AUJ65_02330 [Candidatus Micrarchaeota archaeon CG1_02_51_15]HII39120.1 DUF86 domain-containing protein [Candidatus Micrarchaeota archaeon]
MTQEKQALNRLYHVRESIRLIEEYLAGVSKTDFMEDSKLQDAITRRLEIVGEAVNNLPSEITAKHPETNWKKIVGMRIVFAHAYLQVDLKLIWKTCENKLPLLKQQVEKIIAEEEKKR